MYLNVRRPPLRSKFRFNPLALLFARPVEPLQTPISPSVTRARSRSTSPTRSPATSVPIAPIPPTTNPRGELIFSSRVDRTFRESYERYRGKFEAQRSFREREAAAKTWWGWLMLKMPWCPDPPQPPLPGSHPPTPVRTPSVSLKGRNSSSATPSGSRRASPVPSGLREVKNDTPHT
jgi:hypothetical protein